LLTMLLAGCGSGGGGGTPAPNNNPPPSVSGLDQRPDNQSCIAPSLATGSGVIGTEDAFPTAPAFASPTKVLQAPGAPGRWYVLQKGGLISVFDTASPGSAGDWLDFTGAVNSSSEGGLLGMAFHPDFPAVPEVFVSYTGDPGGPMISYVSRIILDDVDQPLNPVEQIVLTVDQDQGNHNGGDIAFGADRLLYIGLGDGGGGNDPNARAQDTTRLLGSMLRIDVLGVAFPTPGYTIPADNPFAASPAKCGPAGNASDCPEIYAWGLRNPWRWSFDDATGQLWLGDVGQGAWEEVDRIERGGNYGWPCREGAHDNAAVNCNVPGAVEPVAEYPHTAGNFSITGGAVYRGNAITSLLGRYVFGDFGSGRIWALADDMQGGFINEELIDTPHSISAFAIGEDSELYYADYSGGRIHRLTVSFGPAIDPVPDDLVDTGCVDATDPTQAGSGLIPYAVNAGFWSDGATKSRYVALPNGTTISIGGDDDWTLPPGSVILKTFSLAGSPVETRLFMRHPDGVWAGYTYEWNATATQALRVRGGKVATINGQMWTFPSEGECLQCHTAAAGFSLGLETAQLNGDLTYAATGRTANQLTTLDSIGVFTSPLPTTIDVLPRLADPEDTAASLNERARAYLHTNCAQCHRLNGPTPSDMDLRYTTGLDMTNACEAIPQSGDLGIGNPRIIAAGDAARSVLIARMDRRDVNGMPPVASHEVDAEGVMLISDWIDMLTTCQ